MAGRRQDVTIIMKMYCFTNLSIHSTTKSDRYYDFLKIISSIMSSLRQHRFGDDSVDIAKVPLAGRR